jgi:hypothetical protein
MDIMTLDTEIGINSEMEVRGGIGVVSWQIQEEICRKTDSGSCRLFWVVIHICVCVEVMACIL